MRPGWLTWVVLTASVVAILTARPHAGSWNDGSRLAGVESLADFGTWRIDDSVYVHPDRAARPPYAASNPLLNQHGTLDKLEINGHFYSDKSPVPGLLMAGVYSVWRAAGGPSAADRPDLFALGLTWLFSVLPFAMAVMCIGRITRHLDVPEPWATALTASFALGSLALPYAAQVNNHVLLLGTAAGIAELALRPGGPSLDRTIGLGLLTGLAYSIDLGAGPPLAAAVGAWAVWSWGRTRVSHLALFVASASIFPAIHHGFNFQIGGTFSPANANPAFFQWEGCPHNSANLTGGWSHPSVGKFLLYSLDLLGGKKGFLFYSLPMLLAVIGSVAVLRRRSAERPFLLVLAFWAIATWLAYAVTSRNLSGSCLSIRWFVPLLVPGYVFLGVLLRDRPTLRREFGIFAIGSAILTVELIVRGPWNERIPYLFWPVAGLALAVSIGWRLKREPATSRARSSEPLPDHKRSPLG